MYQTDKVKMNFRKEKTMKKKLFLSVIATISILFAMAGCDSNKHTLSFLKVDGDKIVNNKGNSVHLHGVNAGGLGVIEQWMTGFASSSTPESDYVAIDHYTTSKVWIERFGYDETLSLWELYQESWWSEQDFINCKNMGINVIRLPFTYMNVDFGAVMDFNEAGTYDFTFLDNFVSTAEKYGIYTILDLHGAYGSQNGQDHSGQTFDSAEEVTFYSNERLLSLTTNLWGAIAEHYKDNPAIAGYDLLNEPLEKAQGVTTKRHWDALDRFYKAIREVDNNHIVIFESCWGGSGLPQPSLYNWNNCMYSFHHYTGAVDNYIEHKYSFEASVLEIESQNFGVPLFMGEFTAYNNEQSWEFTLDYLNNRKWHWTSWTYKVWNSSGWGIYNIKGNKEIKIDAHNDDLDLIIYKFQNNATKTNAVPYTFESGKTLIDVFVKYCNDETTR